MIPKIIFLLFLILLVIPFAIADSSVVINYTSAGTPDTDYQLGSGLFNLEMVTDSRISKGLNDPKGVPLVADFDNDGNVEIAVLDGATIRVYYPVNLSTKDTYTFPTGTAEFSQLYSYDIDDDNNKEFIVVDEDHYVLYIIQYNSSEMTMENNMSLTSLLGVTSERMVACRASNECILTFAKQETTALSVDMFAIGFNSTNISYNKVEIYTSGCTSCTYCPPIVEHIAVQDYDRDNDIEFIGSWVQLNEGSTKEQLMPEDKIKDESESEGSTITTFFLCS